MCATSARRFEDSNVAQSPLYLALELGDRHWTLGTTIGLGQRPRRRVIAARALDALWEEIARAKQRFHLPADAPVVRW